MIIILVTQLEKQFSCFYPAVATSQQDLISVLKQIYSYSSVKEYIANNSKTKNKVLNILKRFVASCIRVMGKQTNLQNAKFKNKFTDCYNTKAKAKSSLLLYIAKTAKVQHYS